MFYAQILAQLKFEHETGLGCDIDSGATGIIVDCWLLTVEGGVKKMKIARIICCELDSTLRPTIKRGFDIIPV